MTSIHYNSRVSIGAVLDWVRDEMGLDPDGITSLTFEAGEVTAEIKGGQGLINRVSSRVIGSFQDTLSFEETDNEEQA